MKDFFAGVGIIYCSMIALCVFFVILEWLLEYYREFRAAGRKEDAKKCRCQDGLVSTKCPQHAPTCNCCHGAECPEHDDSIPEELVKPRQPEPDDSLPSWTNIGTIPR